MSVVVGEAVEALNEFPAVNSSIDGSDVIYHGYYDIGIAVSSERGLVVPILRDADQRSLADIEKAIVDFGTRAKANKLTMDDLTGGTFSITNGGIFGSMMSTPKIGRAHVCTPVTNAHIVCRLLIEKKKKNVDN